MTFEQRTIRALILLERERIASAERIALAEAEARAASVGAVVAQIAGLLFGMLAGDLAAIEAPASDEGGAS